MILKLKILEKKPEKFSILPNICDLYLFFISNIMYKFLVILFVVKLYVPNSIFKSF